MALINATWQVTHTGVVLLDFDDFTDGEPRVERTFINDRVAVLGGDAGLNIGRKNMAHTVSFTRVRYFDNDDEARTFLHDHTNELPNLPADCTIEWLRTGVMDTLEDTALTAYRARVENNFFVADYTLIGGAIFTGSITTPPPEGFAYLSPVYLNHNKVPSDQTDFPVLISLTDDRFKDVSHGGHVESSSGFDIQPFPPGISSTSPPLDYELEFYDPATGHIIMWVKAGLLNSVADTIIFLAYGNVALTTDGSTPDTWDNAYLNVYHVCDGTTLDLSDSAGAATLSNVNTVTATTGKIDGGAGFVSASTQHLANGSVGNPGNAFTFSAWVKATSFPNAYNTVMFMVSSFKMKALGVKSNGKLTCYVDATAAVSYDGTGSHTLSTATWYYVAMVYSSAAGLIGYVNGASDGTVAANGNPQSTAQLDIGNDQVTGSRLWNGSMDEIRISSTVRSADWLLTEYNNQSSPGTFETLGAEIPA